MPLLQNYSLLAAEPIRNMGGLGVMCIIRSSYNRPEQLMNQFVSMADTYDGNGNSQLQKAGLPNGYSHPYQWAMPIKGGGMSSYQSVYGAGSLTAQLMMGKNMSASLIGSGGITSAALSMIIQLAANISGAGSLSASLALTLNMSVNMIGSGNVSGALAIIAWCVAQLTGSGTLAGSTLRGTADMTANMTSAGDLVTAQSCANAVWEALAAAHANPGTMGKKLNDAGSSVNPWTEELPGSYLPGQAGKILSDAFDNTTYDMGYWDALWSILPADPASQSAILAAIGDPGFKKGVAYNNFMFPMRDSNDHVTPRTGLTISAKISIDNSAFFASTNAATETGLGVYKIDLTSAEMNGNEIMIIFTAAGADPTIVTIKTR